MNDIESNDRPKWLLELENRKRKPRLAHEAGAGAPCMICAATCPGLDLHFWRKICKNCKCNKDDHDVDDEDFPQFDLLFGASRKYKKKPILLYINNEKGYAEEAFEWVPPDTTKELATDYMKALPVEKLPIKGSAGAALRRQLLQKQLPLHDIDHKVCDELSEEEKNEFENYLEDIKKYVGQGTVTKILSARPFDRSLVTPANATDMQHFGPQLKMNAQSSTVQLRTPSSFTPKNSYKRDPCESVKKHDRSLQLQNDCNHIKNIKISEEDNLTGNSGYTAVKAESTESGVYNKGDHPTSFSKTNNSHDIANKEILTTDNSTPASSSNSSKDYKEACKDKLKNPSAASSFSYLKPPNNDTFVPENILANTLFPSSTAQTNGIIGSTLDEKGLMFIREKLTTKYRKQENQGQAPYNAPSFARDFNSSNLLPINEWIASQKDNAINDTQKTVAGTMKPEKNIVESIPVKAEKEIIKPISQMIRSTALNSMPVRNSEENEKLQERNRSLTPTSEITNNLLSKYGEPEFNSFLTPAATTIYSEKLENQIFPYGTIDIAKQSVRNLQNTEQLRTVMEELSGKDPTGSQKCQKCEEEIRVGDVAVITEKMKNVSWHPGCFVCSTCNELLVDLLYFYYKNKLYCGRDLAMLLGIPRCFACDELIFLREYTVAEGHNYHVKHFCCWDCDVPLAGKQYITENDRPLCLPCYQKTYAKTCNTCENIIAADQQGVAVKDLNFHATESCFCCCICRKNLLQGKIAVKEKKLFCSKECISKFLHA